MAGLSPSIVEFRFAAGGVLDGTYPAGPAMVEPVIQPGAPSWNGRYQLWEDVASAGRVDVGIQGGSIVRVYGALGGANDLSVFVASNADPANVNYLVMWSGAGTFQGPDNAWNVTNFAWAPPDGSVFVPPGFHIRVTGTVAAPAAGPARLMLQLGGGWGNQVFQGVTSKL